MHVSNKLRLKDCSNWLLLPYKGLWGWKYSFEKSLHIFSIWQNFETLDQIEHCAMSDWKFFQCYLKSNGHTVKHYVSKQNFQIRGKIDSGMWQKTRQLLLWFSITFCRSPITTVFITPHAISIFNAWSCWSIGCMVRVNILS